MIRRTSAAAVVACAFVVSACDQAATAPDTRPSLSVQSFDEGSYLVRSSGSGFPANFAARVRELGGTVTFAHDEAGVGAVSGMSAESAAKLAKLSGIAGVDQDNFTTITVPSELEVEGFEPGVESPAAPNTATFYPRQWHLRQIEAQVAWAAGRRGAATTRVGILDTGLGYTHPDLAGRVDLVASKSFVPSDDAAVQALFPGAHPIADLHYHGTHVGATVASNAIAAAGVTSGVTLVGIKVCNRNGSCPTSGVLQGVLYAADQGLAVANLSLGGTFMRRDASAKGGNGPSFIATINQVYNYANRKKTVVVVSAGNSAIDMDNDGNSYKAYCSAPTVICVSATGPTSRSGTNGPWQNPDALASYSNYGVSAINVAAPGGNGSSNVTAACSPFSYAIPQCRTGVFVLGINGTSMASPHVAALAALISEDVGRNPGAIRSRLQDTADDLGVAGADPQYGNGRINVRRALGL
ncbi:MAG: S8 family serine peptidase [Gemmatimonadota bacterium]